MTERAFRPDLRARFEALSAQLAATFKRLPWLRPLIVIALIFAIPANIAVLGLAGRPTGAQMAGSSDAYPATPPPPVEPMTFKELTPDTARAINDSTPFAKVANPPARPFAFAGGAGDMARATDCLAAAAIYEAGDDAVGERAVVQVVLNRVRHPAFPRTVCGVVFQGQERATGCQFTFTCDGAMARTPSEAAWDRARGIARRALQGQVYAPVGTATHYHTDWVVPYWSNSLDKLTAVGTHLFFRWKGWWGTRPAFRFAHGGAEPVIPALGRLSAVHAVAAGMEVPTLPVSAETLAAAPALDIKPASVGNRFGAARLSAMQADGKAFAVSLDRGDPNAWQDAAMKLCSGRGQCRVMGWTRNAPTALPLSSEAIATMAYSYIQDAASGLQRSLWNCRDYARPDRRQCMKDREPMPSPAKGAPATFRIRDGQSEPIAAASAPEEKAS